MWNPFPTRSKPVPIGKKHTNQPRTKARQRQENHKKRSNLEKIRIYRKYKERVSAFFRWETDNFPSKPIF